MISIGGVNYVFSDKLKKRFVVESNLLLVVNEDGLYYLYDRNGNLHPITIKNNHIIRLTEDNIFIKNSGKKYTIVDFIVVQKNGYLYLYNEADDQLNTFSYN